MIKNNSLLCPVCKEGYLNKEISKGIFNIIKKEYIICNLCEAKFIKEDEGFKILSVQNKYLNFFEKYNDKTLFIEELTRISKGGLSNEELKEHDLNIFIRKINEGKIPYLYKGEVPINLKEDERIIILFNNISLSEPTKIRKGTHFGTSIRISKGLWIRPGRFKSHSNEKIKEIDSGKLIITNQRIIFLGENRNKNISLKNIISLEPCDEGIIINRSNYSKTEYFKGINNSGIKIKVEDRTYSEKFSGFILKAILDTLIKER
jgi:hypothetical protein